METQLDVALADPGLMSTSRLRPLALASAVLPVILSLFAPEAAAATPKAATSAKTAKATKTSKTSAPPKRISKRTHAARKRVARAAAPTRLPTPLAASDAASDDARSETLAPLPPPTAMPASALVASPPGAVDSAASSPDVGTTTTTSAGIAFAPAPAADAPTRPALPPVSPTGLVIDLGLGVVAPATPFLKNDDVLGPGLGADIRGGYYVARHIGLVGGLRVSGAHALAGCSDCKNVGYQVPLLVQIAASRTRGIYGEAGVGLLSGYALSKGDATLRLSTPAVLKLGAGYRIGLPGTSSLERQTSADIHVGVDLGQMTTATAEIGKASGSASIENPVIHVVVGAGIIGHFAL